jgi:hypothetical protein
LGGVTSSTDLNPHNLRAISFMSRKAGWSEDEARAAVTAYFKLLAAEREGRRTNKRELYRELSERFSNRVPKAFELKFQNISAIMYEQRLPYLRVLNLASTTRIYSSYWFSTNSIDHRSLQLSLTRYYLQSCESSVPAGHLG